MSSFRSRSVIAAALALAAASAQARGPAPPAPTSPPRPALLREGSFVRDVVGRVVRDVVTGWVTFVIEDPPPRTLIMLPNRKLEEIERVLEAAPGQEAVFAMSGQVFVYRGRNFLLPTHAPELVEFRAPPAPAPVTAPGDDQEPTGDTVEDIMRELAEAVGPLHRSAGGAEAGPAPDLQREGTMLLARRGRVHRNDRGARIFVFEADASGLADPPLVVMPCLLLDRMDRTAGGQVAPILLSGQVYVYRGRRYVMPTVYRIPYDRVNVRP